MKIFSIVGARPQFIKLASLSELLSAKHEELIVHTGQHYDYAMSEQIFNDLGIRKADIDLGIGSGSHASQTGEMMAALEKAMLKEKPALVIVFGDTNSTLAGTLSAAKLNIPVVHIEAGLRSYNKSMPEEINRIVTDHCSSALFAPTQNALKILEKEGLKEISYLTGDIMVDTLSNNLKIAENKSSVLERLNLSPGNFSLLTLHRAYNVDNPEKLTNILKVLDQLKQEIVFPVHPRTRKMINNTDFIPKNIRMTEPLGYLDFILLEKNAERIITDSGGIQKEAFILKRPCFTLRTETEWTETVEEGWNLLINPDSPDILEKIMNFKVAESQREVFGRNVSEKMVKLIDELF